MIAGLRSYDTSNFGPTERTHTTSDEGLHALLTCTHSTRNLEQFNTKPPSTHLHQAFLFQRRGFGEVTLFDCAGQAVVAATTRW